MKTTKVIELYGGPGVGKTTTACELFTIMKTKGHSVELVREVAKSFAWKGQKIDEYDQFWIVAEQLRLEKELYGKVEYIITDAPVDLCSLYLNYYFGIDIPDIPRSAKICRFYLPRIQPYVNEGRFEDEETAKELDKEISDLVRRVRINNYLEDRAKAIYNWIYAYEICKDSGETSLPFKTS